ncbi:hypothetical protein CEXT_459631 [Caerostris extrusa]|uniref:Uncharacterized protein n=1 Tax=Caerostris extrusa TaxID=172846 RepID=A0AAV4QXT7_CAEEX|nr:hypothetical protein CEXT_459631 [Caerostris extrusa]
MFLVVSRQFRAPGCHGNKPWTHPRRQSGHGNCFSLHNSKLGAQESGTRMFASHSRFYISQLDLMILEYLLPDVRHMVGGQGLRPKTIDWDFLQQLYIKTFELRSSKT